MGMNRKSKTDVITLRGSYTVEAACLSGIILLTIFAVIFLTIGINKRLYYTARASEAAAAGSTEAVRERGDGLARARETLSTEKGSYSVTGSKREIVVSFEENINFPFGNLKWNIRGEVRSKVVRPVTFLEKVRKSRVLKKQLEE